MAAAGGGGGGGSSGSGGALRVFQWGLRDSSDPRPRADAVPSGHGSGLCDPAPLLIGSIPLPDGVGLSGIAAGNFFGVLWLTNGTAWSWGKGQHFRTGLGSEEDTVKPTRIAGLASHRVAHADAGDWFALFVSTEGRLLRAGRFGGRSNPTPLPEPLFGTDPAAPRAVVCAAGDRSIAVCCSDGSVWAYGSNEGGQCGPAGRGVGAPGAKLSSAAAPVHIALPGPAVHVSMKGRTCLAALADGRVAGWGLNSCCQIVVGGANMLSAPCIVALPDGFHAVAVATSPSDKHGTSAAVGRDGRLAVWGSNYKGKAAAGRGGEGSAVAGDGDCSESDEEAAGHPARGGRSGGGKSGAGSHSDAGATPSIPAAFCSPGGAAGGAPHISSCSLAVLHSLAVDGDAGRLFLWGSGSDGRLGFPEFAASKADGRTARYLYNEWAPRELALPAGRAGGGRAAPAESTAAEAAGTLLTSTSARTPGQRAGAACWKYTTIAAVEVAPR